MLRNIIIGAIFGLGSLLFFADSVKAGDLRTVFIVQVFLNSHGYSVGEPDGIVGPATAAALDAFASDHSIDPNVSAFVRYSMQRNLSQRQEIDDQAFLSEVREDVASRMRNPSSAQFRDIFSITGPSLAGGVSTYLCGQVNGHNAFGGYAGFQWFYGRLFSAGEEQIFIFSRIKESENDLTQFICSMTFSK